MEDIHDCGETDMYKHLEEMKALLPLKKANRHTVGDSYRHLERTRHILEDAATVIPNV